MHRSMSRRPLCKVHETCEFLKIHESDKAQCICMMKGVKTQLPTSSYASGDAAHVVGNNYKMHIVVDRASKTIVKWKTSKRLPQRSALYWSSCQVSLYVVVQVWWRAIALIRKTETSVSTPGCAQAKNCGKDSLVTKVNDIRTLVIGLASCDAEDLRQGF